MLVDMMLDQANAEGTLIGNSARPGSLLRPLGQHHQRGGQHQQELGGNRNFDPLYTMDELSRLLRAQQGIVSSGAISSVNQDEQWKTSGGGTGLDQAGNWLRHRLDLNGNTTFTDAGDQDQSSDTSYNAVNETQSRTFTLGGSSTTYSYSFDAAGNQTDDGKSYTYLYDPFGRLRFVKTRGGSPAIVAEYRYNGLNYRLGIHSDVTRSGGGAPDGTVDSNDPWYYSCFDERWREVGTVRGSDTILAYPAARLNAPLQGRVEHSHTQACASPR
jgi:hypothetical protein